VIAPVPELRTFQPQLQPQSGQHAPSQVAPHPASSEIRAFLRGRGNSALADRGFYWLILLCALSIFGLVALIAIVLMKQSSLVWHQFGIRFFYTFDRDPVSGAPIYWDPINGHYSAVPFIYGTLLTSFLALLLAVPLAIGVAIFLTEMCPKALRGILGFLTELLAAVPSVIYGFWALFVLVPMLRDYLDPWLVKVFGWTTLFDDSNPTGLGFTASAIILAIMILPIISSLTREVMVAVPHSQREAVLALGATRWEMIRTGVLRNARIGIVGAIILGLGRALGETMAVAMVIGNASEIHRSLLSNGNSMAAAIANQYAEAVSDLHRSALTELGLALFIVTIIVNACARLLVWAVTRGAPTQTH
jgi:phosphate transport system permease protein